jgi:predicted nucleic acid-binding protein
MSGKVFLDTNIIVYAHDDASPAKRTKAQEIVFDGIRTGNTAISAQVLSEFYVTVTRKAKKPMPIAKARQEIALLSNMETADVDVPTIRRAIDIQERWQISFWDGLIVAAAEQTHCSTVFSEDLSDGQTYGAVTVRNPFRGIGP